MKAGYERIEVSLHPEVARLLEKARGNAPRAAFIRSLIREYLEDALGPQALNSFPAEEEERPGRKPSHKSEDRVEIEFLLHPEMARLLDEVQERPRARFVRSLIKAYLRDSAGDLASEIKTLLKDE